MKGFTRVIRICPEYSYKNSECKKYICWGSIGYNALKELRGVKKELLKICGLPRMDLYIAPLSKIVSDQHVEANRFEKYFLINVCVYGTCFDNWLGRN